MGRINFSKSNITPIGKRMLSTLRRAKMAAATVAQPGAATAVVTAAGAGVSSGIGPWAIRTIKKLPSVIGNPKVNIPFLVGGASLFAGSRVLMNYKARLRQTQSTGIQKFVFGPGYPVWFKTRGMSHENLGASGDLALGLSSMRHSSIF